MTGIRVAIVLAALACGSLIAACGDSPPEEAATPGANAKKASPVAGLPPEMVSAVSSGRSSTVISLHFALGKSPLVDQALPVDIAIVPHRDFTSVRGHFQGGEDMAVTVGNEMEVANNAKPESVIKHQLVLLPRKEGVYMISATIETESPTEGTVSRVYSLPMIVAATETATPAPAAAAPAPAPPQ
jgi:hypothetical protein